MATTKKQTKPKSKVCASCGKDKKIDSYYSTMSKMFPDQRLNICKTCILNTVDTDDINSVKELLRQIDKPFIASLWINCVKDYPDNPIGNFLKTIGSLPQYKNMTWENSSFDMNLGDDGVDVADGSKPKGRKNPTKPEEISPELFDKWGYEFTPKEIIAFEALYNDLKNNYKLPTASHVEFLKLACISRVKATNAMARGDTKEARDYMAIFKDMTSAGKLQPAQFSKADLSEGLDTFSQLVRRVEMSVDVIPILPRFLEQPKDKVDICIWAYVNYVRGLKGLPDVEYNEIYKWYEDRKADYEKNMTDNNLNVEIDYDGEDEE